MNKSTSYLLGILLTIIIGSYFNYIICCNTDEITSDVPMVSVPEKHTLNGFHIIDSNGELKVDLNDNFNFNVSKTAVLLPLSKELEIAVGKVISYFKEHPGKALTITGYYTDKEINNSAYPNLGLARASAIKNFFVTQGMLSKHINTLGELKNTMIADTKSVLYGPEDFGIVQLANSDLLEEEMNAIALEIKDKPLLLYFKTGAATLKLTTEQRVKVEKIARYLDKIDESKCYIEGHTDNTGNPENNMVLGQERADFARDYLIRNHIRASKVTAVSKGQNQPIATNDSADGRAKNRRIVVTIN